MNQPELIPELIIVRLPHAMDLALPAYESHHAAGLDLRAAVEDDASIILHPGERVLVPTGMIFELPQHHEAQVRPPFGPCL